MDWIGIIFFILIMVLKAMGDSEKQKKAKQARQGRPASVPSSTAAEPRRSPEVIPPVAMPDLNLPPIFSFPFFETVEDKPEEKPAKKTVVEHLPQREYVQEKPAYIERPNFKSPPQQPAMQKSEILPGLDLNKAMEGIIWSEILQPPRAMRPLSAPFVRGRGWR